MIFKFDWPTSTVTVTVTDPLKVTVTILVSYPESLRAMNLNHNEVQVYQISAATGSTNLNVT
jgi:hypothetical protein